MDTQVDTLKKSRTVFHPKASYGDTQLESLTFERCHKCKAGPLSTH
jgi:hypothetical protein